MWLLQRFRGIFEVTREQCDRQIKETKCFTENLAELNGIGLVAAREWVIFDVGIIAVIALASAGLWIGVAGVALVLTVRRWSFKSVLRRAFYLEGFRRRFDSLLGTMNGSMDVRWDDLPPKALKEDKEFIQQYEDSILFPVAVRYGRRKKPSSSDLEHIQTLYCEYVSRGGDESAARRVREHITGILSKIETQIESTRQMLVAKIDGGNPEGAIPTKEFSGPLNGFSVGLCVLDAEDKALIERLRSKDQWTFDEADKVRKLCATRRDGGWDYDDEDVRKVYDGILVQIGNAAARCGLDEQWKWYAHTSELFQVQKQGDSLFPARLSLQQRALKNLRRIIGRQRPEAMYREFKEYQTDLRLTSVADMSELLKSLESYGYDPKLVEREMRAIRKHMVEDKSDRLFQRQFQQELEAAQAFASSEETCHQGRSHWREGEK